MIRALFGWLRRDNVGVSEATVARQRAEKQLEQTHAETAYYAALAQSLRELREANHLTELFFTNRHTPRSSE